MTDIEKKAEEMRNKIGIIPALNDGCATDDNIAIVLADYFSRHPDKPDDDTIDDEIGWSRWAVEKANDALDRIVESLEAEVRKARREALEELLQYFEHKTAEVRAGVRRALTQADKDARMEEACWYEGVAYQVRKRIDAPVPTSRPQGGLTP